ncbi:hypothetical protein DY000_02007535 [Brassica cretica]|uniref:Arabidopsis retrotransposon Orf1 C-terminal domain-containing protein n=1 Tax=Brassica cretica TaxID=69181 RepID=A0ABQ7C945_BRACR|nr:hypothetical protein DY000_02007535 [Brassica cretica]
MYERRTKRRFDVGGSSAAPPPPPFHDQYPCPREHEDEPIPLFDHFDDTQPTRFVDPDVVRALGIRSDLEDLFGELGMGNFATHPQVLYPEVVRQFMATVNVYYANERANKASEGVMTFFICDIRYRVPLLTLCTIYGFETERQHAIVPDLPGIGTFWSHIATGFFDAAKTVQSDIRHPTLRYFMNALANTLLCKMEPSKVRVQDLTLVYYVVRSLVHMENIEEPADDAWPNLKMKPFQSSGQAQDESFPVNGKEEEDGWEPTYSDLRQLRSPLRRR